MTNWYTFSCGCRFPILEENPPEGVIPLLDFDIETVPQDCPAVWDLLGRGDTKGVFQLESSLGKTWTKKLKPENGEHLGALGAILRPGSVRAVDDEGVSMTQHYCRRKNNEEEVKGYHPAIDPILKPTYNVMIYQEQAMQIAQAVAGFDLQQADQLRKCVSGDTRFLSRQRGWVSIDTLLTTNYQDDDFLVMDIDGFQKWRRLDKIWHTGKHDVTEVLSSSGFAVKTTKYHQILTAGGWKARMRLLDQEDHLVAIREASYDGRDLESPDFAMIVACLITEGCVLESKTNATFVAFDKYTMDTFVAAFQNHFGVTPRIDEAGRVARLLKHQKDSLVGKMKFGKSDSRKIPEWMMGMTKETTRRFLSFMLAAEGVVSESGQFEFSSKSLCLARQVKLLLTRFAVRSLLMPKNVPEYGTYWTLYVNCKVDQEKMLNELTVCWPDSKRDTLRRVMEQKSDRNFTSDVVPTILTSRFINQYPYSGRHESGTAFTSPLSRPRFARMAQVAGDPWWCGLASGKQQYDLLASTEQMYRVVDAYDFTVSGQDSPFIVAEGLVIHNSIGKKLPEEMVKCKKLFLDGSLKAGIIAEAQAEELFGWIEKSQRYSFNHCIHKDTFIRRPPNGESTRHIGYSVERMYRIRHDREFAFAEGHMSLHYKWKRNGHYGYGLSMRIDGSIYPNIIRDIKRAGVRVVWRVMLEDGRYIDVTENHKFPTDRGDLAVMDFWQDKYYPSLYIFIDGRVEEVPVLYIEKIGVEETYDVTMDGPSHNFVVGCGIITCNSHAISYGLTGYDTAYIKAHFPLAFFTSWLCYAKEKQDPLQEISELVNDARLFDVVVEPPDLRTLQAHFHTDRKVVRFGLSDIKGIGEAMIAKLTLAVREIEAKLAKPIEKWSWYEFLVRCSSKLTCNVVRGLIEVGAMRCFGMGRRKMLAEYNAWTSLTDKEQEWVQGDDRSNTIIEAMNRLCLPKIKKSEKLLFDFNDGGGCSNERRRQYVAGLSQLLENPPSSIEDTPLWISWAEEQRLGISLSCSKVDSCNISEVTCTCKDYMAGRKGFLVFCVVVDAIREIVTKRGKAPGSKMAFLTVNDGSCALTDVVCFPDAWKEYRDFIQVGQTVFIHGERDGKKDSDVLVVKKAVPAPVVVSAS